MISILHRYIIRAILLSAGLVTIVVMGLIFFITLLGELKDLGVGDYRIGQAMGYVLLRLPHELYQLFPILMLLGGMIGLGVLSSQRELVVMRTSGFSLDQVSKAVFVAAVILTLLITLVGEWIAPAASYLAAVKKESAKSGGQAVVTGSGIWMHEGDTFLYVEQVVNRHRLEGVTGYQFNAEHRLQETYYAKSLDLQDDRWVLHDVMQTTLSSNRLYSQHVEQLPLSIKLNPNLLTMGLIEPSEMSLGRLLKFIRYLVRNGLQATPYQYELWERIFQPLTSLVMVFLAIPFVLGVRGSSAMGWRWLWGVLIGFLFYILNAFFGQASVIFQFPPWLAALSPSLLFIGLSVFLLRSLR